MIKVLKKTSEILTLIAENQPVAFKWLQQETGWHKATLSVNLRSLEAIGFVERLKSGGFVTGPGLRKLCGKDAWLGALERVSREHARKLSSELDERVVVAVFHEGGRKVLAKFDSGVPAAPEVWATGAESMLSNATGLVLLAGMSGAERDAFFRDAGMSARRAEYERKFQEIIDSGFCVEHYNDDEVAAVAFPVSPCRGGLAAVVCVVLPECRFHGEKKALIFSGLRDCAARIASEFESR